MAWWGWIVIGTLLFCAELFAIDAQFFLIFIGAGAIVVGLTGLLGVELPAWGQWLLFAALAATSMVMFRRKLYDKIRGGVVPVSDSVVGGKIVLVQELKPGATGRADYRGSSWTVFNTGDELIPAGGSATIEAMDGFTLRVALTQRQT
ncbi:MAG TPA: NfeD family protein [Burkholderiales bacterium]|nr:NfeD family protein [Burkholderiales bacterium]